MMNRRATQQPTSDSRLGVAEDEAAKQSLHSSPALLTIVVFILSGCGTYGSLVLLLRNLPFHPSSADPAWPAHEVGLNVFACSLTLFSLSLLCRVDRHKQIVALLITLDNVVAFLSYLLQHFKAVPVLLDCFGRPAYPIRYIMWSHTIPTMIYLIGLISNYNPQKVAYTMYGSIVMLATGMVATYCPSNICMLISIFLSVSSFVAIITSMWFVLVSAQKLAQKLTPRRTRPKLLQCLQYLFATTWTVFPTVWFLGAFKVVTTQTEGYLYLLADVSAKILFSALLLESNFMSIEEAQRIAQEKRKRDVQIVRSITDEKRMEAELLYRSKYQQFANASHEIRTPMNGIIGVSDLLLTTNPSEEQRNYIDTIRWSSNILLRLINDILSAAKSDITESSVEEVPFSLWDEIRMSTALFDSLSKSKGLKISYEIDEMVPERFLGAPASLRQVLLNLLGNALKFTSRGCIDVLVTLSQDSGLDSNLVAGQYGTAKESLEYRATHTSHHLGEGVVFVQVEVRDTGPGIPEEARDRIFQPFTQASDLVSVQYGGTGLGLHICQSLVSKMGGRIWLTSALNEGSSFIFTMRLRRPASAAPAEVDTMTTSNFVAEEGRSDSGDRRPSRGRGMHLLVVEDNDVNQLVISNMLRTLQCTYEIVDGGDKAVRACRDATFDVILMDCYMPGMDGFEATRQIRAQERLRGGRTTIFALTASATDDDRRKCFEAGMDFFLVKPIRLNDLDRALTFK